MKELLILSINTIILKLGCWNRALLPPDVAQESINHILEEEMEHKRDRPETLQDEEAVLF